MSEPLTKIEAPAIVVPPSEKSEDRTDKPKSPTTTMAEDLSDAGQRRVNLIWERQQALIATGVVGTLLLVSSWIALLAIDPNATDQQLSLATTAFMLIGNVGSLVIGFYFGRTNHTKTGGVLNKER